MLRQLFAGVGNIAKTCWENADDPAIPAIPLKSTGGYGDAPHV